MQPWASHWYLTVPLSQRPRNPASQELPVPVYFVIEVFLRPTPKGHRGSLIAGRCRCMCLPPHTCFLEVLCSSFSSPHEYMRLLDKLVNVLLVRLFQTSQTYAFVECTERWNNTYTLQRPGTQARLSIPASSSSLLPCSSRNFPKRG